MDDLEEKISRKIFKPARCLNPSVRKQALKKGGKCVSQNYISSSTKLKFQCKDGHIWEALPGNVVHQGTWCPKCAIIKQHLKQRIPFSNIENIVKNKNGLLISSEKDYLNKSTKIKVICEQGHHFQTTWDSLNAGRWCNSCGRKSAASKLRLDISIPQKLAKARGGKCLSDVYFCKKASP